MEHSRPPDGKQARGFLTPRNSLSGRYELLGRLGSGGMAEVYLARAVGLEDFEKIVVLKRVLPDRVDDRSYAAMFRDEARVAATLEHPNIVHTHDIGIKDDECFFTMEYLHGEDLKAILAASNKAREQLPLELALQIAVGCAAGLHHAHEQTDYAGHPLNIVHRDVSPSNIIVTRQSGVKLIDFGIAKAASDKEHTGVGVLKGKVAYMSPEQCRGEVLDRRSDIFALGIVLYEMITMERPFRAPNVLGTVHKLLGSEPAPPRQLRPDCPPELERIVVKALQKDVRERYQTAFEMQEELEMAARDFQLLSLPGGLGRYLEHLFGPKPHPWTQRAKRPPAVPRWAWTDLDSTVTARRDGQPDRGQPLPPLPPAPSQSVTPQPVAQPNLATSDTELRDPVITAKVPVSPAPTGAQAVVPPFASDTTAGLSTLGAAAPDTRSSSWAVKHLMIGGLVGGIVAAAGLGLWVGLGKPKPGKETKPAATVVEPTKAPADAIVAGPANGPPAPAMVPPPTPSDDAEDPPLPAEVVEPPLDDEPMEEDPPAPTGDDGNAKRLLDRARSYLLRNPRAAHRDAKAAYELRPTQTALQIMGLAGCRMRNEHKAKYAHRRLRGQARRELESSCLQQGIDLR